MTEREGFSVGEAPRENFTRGIFQVEIPELGLVTARGKVRDIWVREVGEEQYRIMVTTDRQSAFDRLICTISGKAQVLNLLSAYWFERTKDIFPNHMILAPHPNVLVARQAVETLPVEVVLRRYMAKSSTSTSVYHNYVEKSRREIYGIDFPDGLRPNEEFPMGTILTPTTKAETGHDLELTDSQARDIVDKRFIRGTWDEVKERTLALFEYARLHCLERGLILVDTKYEIGLDSNGKLMLIDELHTPDSSRFWLAETYEERFKAGENPDTFDKEILRRWLSLQGFKGEGMVPRVDDTIIEQMAAAYTVPYRMITGHNLPRTMLQTIEESVRGYLNRML